MVSFFRLTTGIVLGSLLVACGQTSGDAPLSIAAFDYSICDTIITTDLDSNGLDAVLQSGTSTEYFTACIEDGVTISDGMSVNISKDYVALVGVSKTGSTIEGLSYTKSSADGGLALINLSLVGAGFSSSCVSITNSVSGTITLAITDINCTSSGDSMGSALNITSSAGSNITASIENSSFTSEGNGMSFTISAGGNLSGSLKNNTITVAGNGLSFTESAGSGITFNLAGNKLRYNGASGPFGDASGFNAVASANGGITLNDTSSGVKNFVCKVAGSAGTFTNVYNAVSSAGASIGGTFSAAGTQNGGNTIGNCP